MAYILYNNKEYHFSEFAYTRDGEPTSNKVQLFGVVLDNQNPSVIGAIHGNLNQTKSWLPMKWNLITGEHYDEGYNLQATT